MSAISPFQYSESSEKAKGMVVVVVGSSLALTLDTSAHKAFQDFPSNYPIPGRKSEHMQSLFIPNLIHGHFTMLTPI